MIDRKALIYGITKFGLGLFAAVDGVNKMVAATATEIGSGGASTVFSVGGFLVGQGEFLLGTAGVIYGSAQIGLALSTPDGLTAQEFSTIKTFVKGFGGGKVTQEGVNAVFDMVGIFDIKKIDDRKLQTVFSFLQAAGATVEDLKNFSTAYIELLKSNAENEAEQKKKDEANPN